MRFPGGRRPRRALITQDGDKVAGGCVATAPARGMLARRPRLSPHNRRATQPYPGRASGLDLWDGATERTPGPSPQSSVRPPSRSGPCRGLGLRRATVNVRRLTIRPKSHTRVCACPAQQRPRRQATSSTPLPMPAVSLKSRPPQHPRVLPAGGNPRRLHAAARVTARLSKPLQAVSDVLAACAVPSLSISALISSNNQQPTRQLWGSRPSLSLRANCFISPHTHHRVIP